MTAWRLEKRFAEAVIELRVVGRMGLMAAAFLALSCHVVVVDVGL